MRPLAAGYVEYVGDQLKAAKTLEDYIAELETALFVAEEKLKLRSMPYGEYLASTHWRCERRRALRRAGDKCQVCSSPSRLDVHHRTYERRGEELASDLVVLCRDCHTLFHENGRLAAP